MADDRELRRLLNTKQDMVEFKGEPSIGGMVDGQIAINKSNNGQLAVHRKKYGKLWKSYMTHNGDQHIERNLEVRGNAIFNQKVSIGTNKSDQMVHIEHPSLDSVVRIGAPSNKAGVIQIQSHAGAYVWQMGVRHNGDKFVIDESSISGGNDFVITTGGNIGIGTATPLSNSDLTLEGGVIALKETTEPTIDEEEDAEYGKIYTKSDNKLYFQDGAGQEHEIAYEE